MTHAAPTSAASRLAAALMACALSAAPLLPTLAPSGKVHACACRAHARTGDCSCSHGHAGAQAVGPGVGKPAPACHARAGAAGPGRAPRQASPNVPCLRGSCGTPERTAATLAGLDPSTLTRPPALVLPRAARLTPEELAVPLLARVVAPETPPPRA